MWKMFFTCPQCGKEFTINGYWRWVWSNPFHTFTKRWTHCPGCGKTPLMTWYKIEKEETSNG